MGCCNSGEADGDRQRDALARRGRQRAFAERAGQAEVALQRGGAVGDETEQVGQCFWLSPSITTRSPGSMIASSNSVARSGGQIFEPGPHMNAALANMSPRSAARLFDLAFIILILPSSSVPLASPFDVWSLGK